MLKMFAKKLKGTRRTPLLILLASLLVFVVVLAGCSGSEKKETTSETETPAKPAEGTAPATAEPEDPYANLPRELTMSFFDTGAVPADEGTYMENRWTKWINENAPAQITEWIALPTNTRREKLNTLIAGGLIPDIMYENLREYIDTLRREGILLPLDDLIDQYAPAYKQYIEDHPELEKYIRFDDGKIYAFSVVRPPSSSAGPILWIRQDWLNKLGLEVPTTTDELIAVAKAFRDLDPDGNGQNDTVPITSNFYGFPFFENMFRAMTAYPWNIVDGKAVHNATTDRYKDYLTFHKTLYDEGLIDREFPTDNNFERQTQFLVNGNSGIANFGPNMGGTSIFTSVMQNNPEADWVPVPQLSTPLGYNPYYGTKGISGTLLAVSKDVKNPKAAVEFLDWALAKGGETLAFGIEDVHYRMENGQRVSIDSAKNAKELAYPRTYLPIMSFATDLESLNNPPNPDPIIQQFRDKHRTAQEIYLNDDPNWGDLPIGLLPSSQELADLMAAFDPYLAEIRLKAITSGDAYTPEQASEDLKKEWIRLGGDKVEQIMTDYWNQNKEVFAK